MSRKSVGCTVRTVLTCRAVLAVPASAQHCKQITGSLSQVAAGRNEVFGLDSNSHIWRLTGTKFVQVPGLLTQVAVGDGTALQKDEIRGIDAKRQIYRFNYGTKTFTQITGLLTQIAVGEGDEDQCHPYEVWGTNASIYRYNYCSNTFEQIFGQLALFATGGGDVSGVNAAHQIYHFDLSTQNFVQVQGPALAQIAVGVNDVWGVDTSGFVYRHDTHTGNFAELAEQTLRIAVGGNGVWDATGAPERFDPSSESFYFPQFSGTVVVDIAVGYGAGVWVIDD